jgi:hypothetical protein
MFPDHLVALITAPKIKSCQVKQGRSACFNFDDEEFERFVSTRFDTRFGMNVMVSTRTQVLMEGGNRDISSSSDFVGTRPCIEVYEYGGLPLFVCSMTLFNDLVQ